MPYLHGYNSEEQQRLVEQAHLLKNWTFRFCPKLENQGDGFSVLELACGVGAQTEIFLSLNPKVKMTCVDISEDQINGAQKRLSGFSNIDFVCSDVEDLNFAHDSFDLIYAHWFYEHLKAPLKALSSVYKYLKPGGSMWGNEVNNATLFLDPYKESIQSYWYKFNDHQWNMGGDPFVGAKIGSYLCDAGFTGSNIQTHPMIIHFDKRDPKQRKVFLEDFKSVLLSGSQSLLESYRLKQNDLSVVEKDLDLVLKNPDSVIHWSWYQYSAVK